jgi:hypothetical protein
VWKKGDFDAPPPVGTRVEVCLETNPGVKYCERYPATIVPHPAGSKPEWLEWDEWDSMFVHVLIDGEKRCTSYHVHGLYAVE